MTKKISPSGSEASIRVTSENFLALVNECNQKMTNNEWDDYVAIYLALRAYQNGRPKQQKPADRDEITRSWQELRVSSISQFTDHLESARTYQDFVVWLAHLERTLENKIALWNVLHMEVQPILKISTEQSHQLIDQFFSPQFAFDSSLPSFLTSNLAQLANVKSSSLVVDVFYCCAGFIRGCNLPAQKIITEPSWLDFVRSIFSRAMHCNDFDPYAFLWMMENAPEHLHVEKKTLFQMITDVITEYAGSPMKSAFNRYRAATVLSTSSSLASNNLLVNMLNTSYKAAIEEQRAFFRKYITLSFVRQDWTDEVPESPGVTDAVWAWQMYVTQLAKKLEQTPELPGFLLEDLITDSIGFFNDYYGEVQTSLKHARRLRRDVFVIVETTMAKFPSKMSTELQQKLWFFLFLAAVSGASDKQIAEMKPSTEKNIQGIMLGLQHDGEDFQNYATALARFSSKFASEADQIPRMVSFIRKNY